MYTEILPLLSSYGYWIAIIFGSFHARIISCYDTIPRMIKKWQTSAILKEDDYKIFSVTTVKRTSPRNKKMSDFYTIESNDWLNIIAITRSKETVLIEQYRHGSDKVELDLPGGIIDSKVESPVLAAVRELREETGYVGTDMIEIGCVNPNPGFFNNKCYTFMATDAVPLNKQSLEDTEDISVKLYPISKVRDLISSGKINHGLDVAAFYFYEQFVKKTQ